VELRPDGMSALAELLALDVDVIKHGLGDVWILDGAPSTGMTLFMREADFGPDVVLKATVEDAGRIQLTIGPAKGSWSGPAHLTYEIGSNAMTMSFMPGSPASLEVLGGCVKDAARRRRKGLRKCRYCMERTPAEHRFAPDVCSGCATEHLGVVY
jgi:hypothetical protein